MGLLTKKLLANRGIKDEEDIEKFLYPDYDKHLHDPFLFTDMDKAAERILIAVRNKEKIILYTDYDTDGIPAGVLLHDFFKEIGHSNFENYIPHRNDEGYGLNQNAIELFQRNGARLIITADCGITDIEEISHAQKNGIDVIVTDHHLPLQDEFGSEILPNAYAVINPKRKGERYPFQMLCGAGVAFKLVQAVLSAGREAGDFQVPPGREKWFLDMVAIATISDRVPLVGENRVLAYYGLKVLRKSPRWGLRKLFQKTFTDQSRLTEEDVGFIIGPRINVASRIDTPWKAFRLLVTNDPLEAEELVLEVNALNERRKGIVAGMLKEAKRKINAGNLGEIILLGNINWHPGAVGLAAQTLIQEYNRPVFLWGRGEGSVLKGSCRSDGAVNVVELMNFARDILLDFGGHEGSGGFSVAPEKLHLLEEKLIYAYRLIKKEKTKEEKQNTDKELALSEINKEMLDEIEALAPFGEGNPRPLFLLRDISISDVQSFGRDKKHLKLLVGHSNCASIPAIKFFSDSSAVNNLLENETNIMLKAHVERDMFRNAHGLRLRIVEIESA